jgi:nucleolar protein 56
MKFSGAFESISARFSLARLVRLLDHVSKGRISLTNLGIGHSFARHNIKFDEKRQDKAIINSFSLLDTMEKNLNTFSMRLKESYGWHFPELSKLVTDNEMYAKLVAFIGVCLLE